MGKLGIIIARSVLFIGVVKSFNIIGMRHVQLVLSGGLIDLIRGQNEIPERFLLW